MDNSRMKLLEPKRKATKRKKIVVISIISLIALFVLSIILIVTPFGNTALHAVMPGVDTPADKIVKNEFNNKIQNSPALSDKNKEKLQEMEKKIPMSKVTNAAGNANNAAELYAEYSGKDKETARNVINVVYSDSRLDKLRSDVASNNWIGALNEYKKLENTNTFTEVFKNAENKSSNSAQEMQQKASKLYNQAVQSQSTSPYADSSNN